MIDTTNALVSVPPPALAPLAGYTVAIASEHRRPPIAEAIEAVGARTACVQAVRAFSTSDERTLRAATEAALGAPIDELIVTSGFGFGVWMRSATRWGLGDVLVDRARGARLLASNPRAADGLREAGLQEIWSTALGTTEGLVRYLRRESIAGRRVVMQCDSPETAEFAEALRYAGGDVVEIKTYQCAEPRHTDILRRLGDQITLHQVDAVLMTSAFAVEHLLRQARADGRLDAVCNALAADVPAVCRGMSGAAPLRALGVTALLPPWPGSEETAETVSGTVGRRALRLQANGHDVELRGHAVVIDGVLIPIPPGPMGVLRALARRPGQVLSHADIRAEAPILAQNDDHAIEMSVSRLRRSLHDPHLVQTVMRHGYRLSV